MSDSDQDFNDEILFFTKGVRISHCPTCDRPDLQEMLGRNELTGSPCCERCGFETAEQWRDFDEFSKKFTKFCYTYTKRRAFNILKSWMKKKTSEAISI